MFGPDERPPARHAARASGGRRRFLLAIAVLVALASVPSLAVMLAGAASLESTPGSRSPFLGQGPDGPVRVGPDADATLGAGGRPQTGIGRVEAVPSPRPPVADRPAQPALPRRPGGAVPEAGAVGVPGPRAESCTVAPPATSVGTPSDSPTGDPSPSTPAGASGTPAPSPSASVPEREETGGFALDLGVFGIRVR